MSKNTKRYLISSLITFLTGFCIVLVAQMDSITLQTIKDGSIVSVLFVAVRTGIKALMEAFLSQESSK